MVSVSGARKESGHRMFKKYSQINISQLAKSIIMDAYNTQPIFEYAKGIVKEYKIASELLTSNIDLSLAIVTSFHDSSIPEHTDDGRDSCLIVPLTDKKFTIKINGIEKLINYPFILDTSLPHSATVTNANKILSIDIGKCFEDTVNELSEGVTIDAK